MLQMTVVFNDMLVSFWQEMGFPPNWIDIKSIP